MHASPAAQRSHGWGEQLGTLDRDSGPFQATATISGYHAPKDVYSEMVKGREVVSEDAQCPTKAAWRSGTGGSVVASEGKVMRRDVVCLWGKGFQPWKKRACWSSGKQIFTE